MSDDLAPGFAWDQIPEMQEPLDGATLTLRAALRLPSGEVMRFEEERHLEPTASRRTRLNTQTLLMASLRTWARGLGAQPA